MQAITVAEVADELYGLTPAEFTAARDERARQLRAAGQREIAADIKKLARPTASAWLVNQLARAAQEQMARLYDVAEALSEAQRTLAGDRLRELAADRRQVIAELILVATELAEASGQSLSATVLGEVRATLEAALADSAAREAVRSGRLTRGLTYAGLGEVDLSAALAVPLQRPARAGRGPDATRRQAGQKAARADEAGAGQSGAAAADDGSEAGTAAARSALSLAETAAAEAEQAAEIAQRHVTGIAEQRQFLQRRIQHLQRELDQATAEEAQFARDAKRANRELDAATGQLEAARKGLAQAHRAARRAGQ